MKRVLSIICILVLLFGSLLLFSGCKKQEPESEVRACWVASVGNLDFPSQKGLSQTVLMAELDSIVATCKMIGLNRIYFQVRPMGDALYQSSLFPWSAYLSGEQGIAPEGGFDPLSYVLEKAHGAGLELHAWINPYRIATDQAGIDALCAENPAVKHPEYTLKVDGGLYYNPALPAVRALILEGIDEIAQNYAIDGIHFDDYFYPYTESEIDDKDTYAQYGNGMNLADFRRDAVNQLVKEVRNTLVKRRKNAEFGISPFGIWANRSDHYDGSNTFGMSSYSAIFSDSKKWVEEGWLDYVCPQLYWSDENPAAPYSELVDWWSDLCKKNNTDFHIGLAVYKVGSDEDGWQDGSILKEQLLYASSKEGYQGHSFFRYGLLVQNQLGALDAVKSYYQMDSKVQVVQDQKDPFNILKASAQSAKEVSSVQNLTIQIPSKNETVSAAAISVAGTAPAGQAVWVNGVQAVTNSSGLYTAYVPLAIGENKIEVISQGKKASLKIVRNKGSGKEAAGNPYPTGEAVRSAGDIIEFFVTAPANSTVYLKNDRIQIPLFAAEGGTRYSGEWTIPALCTEDPLEVYDLVYWIETGEEVQLVDANLQLKIYPNGYREGRVLKSDCYQFSKSVDGSQMDHDPLRRGSRVEICALEGTRALLRNGYWVEQSVLDSDGEADVNEPLNYEYEAVEIKKKGKKGYYTSFEEGTLTITLASGMADPLEIKSNEKDLQINLCRQESKSEFSIQSKGERVLAGYDIIPQEDGYRVLLRYHTPSLQDKRVLLDAGHGGKDSGALSAGGTLYPTESELNLLLSQYIQQELENRGARVTLLRAGEETIELDERVEIAEDFAPDLFLSVHHNSLDFTSNFAKASGGMVLYSSPLSEEMAEHISKNLWNGLDSSVEPIYRRQSLRVCRQTRFPAVLIEAGFICNPLEYEMLCNEDIARKIAKNTVDSIEDYFVTVCS